jgi:hypothetical protein
MGSFYLLEKTVIDYEQFGCQFFMLCEYRSAGHEDVLAADDLLDECHISDRSILQLIQNRQRCAPGEITSFDEFS